MSDNNHTEEKAIKDTFGETVIVEQYTIEKKNGEVLEFVKEIVVDFADEKDKDDNIIENNDDDIKVEFEEACSNFSSDSDVLDEIEVDFGTDEPSTIAIDDTSGFSAEIKIDMELRDDEIESTVSADVAYEDCRREKDPLTAEIDENTKFMRDYGQYDLFPCLKLSE